MSKTVIVFWAVLVLAILAGAGVILYVVEDQKNDVFTNMKNVTKIEYSYGTDTKKEVRNSFARKLRNADRYTFEELDKKTTNDNDLKARPNFVFYDKDKKELYNIYIKDQRSNLIIVLVGKKEIKEYSVKNSDLIDYIRNIIMEL